MAILSLDGKTPQCEEGAWIADSAQVIGNVTLGKNASVWYGAVVRADNEAMHIGAGTCIQDGSVLHSDQGYPLHIADRVTVGHKAVLHGCTVGEGSLIGIGAIVLNGARIGRNCLVAAGALVTEGKQFPDGVLIVGSPAMVKRALSAAQIEALEKSAADYILAANKHSELAVRLDT